MLTELSPQFLNVPQAQVQAFSPPALPGSTGGAPMQFVIRTTGDYATLADVALKMQKAARESGLFLFTDVDLKFDTPQFVFKVDADKANRIGINMADVGNGAGHDARRQLRQPVQPLRPQLSGHSRRRRANSA